MLNPSHLEEIKKITQEFFQKTTFEVEIEFLLLKTTLSINLKTKEPQILIGEGGQTLNEIQHLLKVILKRKTKESFFIDLDINDYKKKKAEYLKELAHSVADEVVLIKKEKSLPPMPARERRVIHLTLASRSDITTQSLGQEPKRRVMIRPYP